MKKISVLLAFIVLAFFSGCETDFDVNAKWKDITIVYGLLNQNDTIHYIKINKAFLGSGNALEMAQIPDSSLYDTAVLKVRLEAYLDGNLKATHVLHPTDEIVKDSGTFYHPSQVLYKTNAPLNAAYTYKLVIENKKTGSLITSQTPLIQSFTIEKPRYGVSLNMDSDNDEAVEWQSATYGRRYQVVIRFHYKELKSGSYDSLNCYVDWNLPTKDSKTIDGGEDIKLSYKRSTFYTQIKSQILNGGRLLSNGAQLPYDANATRYAGKVEFIYYVIGDELATYIDVNGPSTGVLLDKPEYTNIENGIGIFSCRYTQSRNYNLNPASLTRLKSIEGLSFQ